MLYSPLNMYSKNNIKNHLIIIWEINFLYNQLLHIWDPSSLARDFQIMSILQRHRIYYPLNHSGKSTTLLTKALFKRTAYSLLLLGLGSPLHTHNINQKFKPFYVRQMAGAQRYWNLKKAYSSYNNALLLIWNLIRSDIPFMVFSGTSLRNPSESFNLKLSSFLRGFGRELITSIFTNHNSMASSISTAFRFMSRSGLNVVVISDALHHRKTIAHCRKAKIYTIGLSPMTSYVELLDFSLPIGSHSLATELYFFKSIVRIKAVASSKKFDTHLLSWKLLINKCIL